MDYDIQQDSEAANVVRNTGIPQGYNILHTDKMKAQFHCLEFANLIDKDRFSQ